VIKIIKTKIGSLVLQNEGGKKVLNKKRASIISIILFGVGIVSQLGPSIFKDDLPKGRITKSDTPFLKDKNETQALPAVSESNRQNLGGVADNIPPPRSIVIAHHFKPIRYKGKQVFTPDTSTQKIPAGANFIGKLLTSIDTRSQQRVHVMLPYGGSHKSGGGSLPPETILMGQFNYSGQGERVFIVFNRAVLPDGQEITIQAQALSSKDYRVGVIGDYHGNKGSQMASVFGPSMISGISEVMVEKQGLGQSFNVAPKSTLKNGIYNGVAKVTETEANDQATQLAQTPKYVTIDSGADVIISLGASYGSNERQE
jgi:hypothetical protein